MILSAQLTIRAVAKVVSFVLLMAAMVRISVESKLVIREKAVLNSVLIFRALELRVLRGVSKNSLEKRSGFIVTLIT